MTYRRSRRNYKRSTYHGPSSLDIVTALFTIWVAVLLLVFLTDREHFVAWAVTSVLVIVLAGAAAILWAIHRTRRRLRLLKKTFDQLQRTGLENEIRNFIARFGYGQGGRGSMWHYRNHKVPWDRLHDLKKILEKKGVKVSLSVMGYVLRKYIDDQEFGITTESIKHSSDNFARLTGSDFEILLKRLWDAMGYTTQLVGNVGDQGGDLVANKDGFRIIIQAKRYSGSVGNDAVQQVVAAKAHYDCGEAIVVTTSDFSREAVELAHSNGVRLIGRKELQELLAKHLHEVWM